MALKMTPRQRVTRKWQLFPGRNKFYCNGYLITAPNSSIFYLTVVLITGTSGLFFAFDCPFLAERITLGIPIIGGILYVFTMFSLFRTSFSDPGIIPRASQDEAAYIEKQIEVPNSLNSPTYRPPPRTKEIFVRGQTVKLKYCFTCKIFRPPRASHCSLCDNCVDRFDHHCPWVGNCVGRRNYRFFYMFIVSLAFLAVFIFACALTHLVLLQTESRDFLEVIRMTPFSVVVSAICFLSVWSVIGLAGFHTYLTSSDQTTNEDIKGSFSSKSGQQSSNPYSRGNICLNCFYILCGPLQPSLIDRRGVVTDQYRLQMQTQDKNNGMPTPPMIVQPLGSVIVDPMHGHNSVELEVPSNNGSHLHGVYRQRSYDNLQNDKSSTSISHLVENELPLASVILPSTSTVDKRLRVSQSSVSDFQTSQDLNKIVSDDEHKKSVEGCNNALSRENSDEKIVLDASKNVYSNIPPTSPSVPNILKNAAADHVYSNIDEAKAVRGNSNGYDNLDLDLDDPLLTSSFSKKKEKPNNHQSQTAKKINLPSISFDAVYTSLDNDLQTTETLSSSTTGTQITSIELKNVLNVVLQKTNQAPVEVIASTAPPASLRQTMIDTALDLDSLDGSSIGNSSQIALVSSKTAIV